MKSQPKSSVSQPDDQHEDPGRILHSEACMAEGAHWLAGHEPRFAQALKLCGVPPLRRRPDGFAPLLQAIISQQVSTHAADAIWKRMERAGLTEPETILLASDEALRTPGLSRQKIRYARALAEANIDFEQLRKASDAAVIATLIEVPGIGRWTAEIYAMFSLGRADVFAPGDLALQEATRRLFDLPERPREAALRRLSDAWSPWRNVAAGLLWLYYRVETNRAGIN